jgi:thiamine-monophosphate kinase
MMDVSDGLAKDLRALTPPGAKPAINAAAMPISAAARRLAAQTKKSPLHHALGDGEDYELVFALARTVDRATFEKAWRRAFPRTRLTRIGQFVRTRDLPTSALRLEQFAGYEHFR